MACCPAPVTRDPELRRLLVTQLEADHGHDPETFLCHEFSICRSRARIDLAVVNGSLTGFEIKSGADRLDRLPRQCLEYDRVFDTVTVVCAPRHLPQVRKLVPSWYGIWVADPAAVAQLEPVRAPGPNPEPSPRARLALLWRDELIAVLADHGEAAKLRATRRALVDQVLECLDFDRISLAVKDRLKARLRAQDPEP